MKKENQEIECNDCGLIMGAGCTCMEEMEISRLKKELNKVAAYYKEEVYGPLLAKNPELLKAAKAVVAEWKRLNPNFLLPTIDGLQSAISKMEDKQNELP